jgi:hypothetical protein
MSEELRNEIRRRCVGCGATAPMGAFMSHYFHTEDAPFGEVVETRKVSDWTVVADRKDSW